MDARGFHHFYIGMILILLWFIILIYRESNFTLMLIAGLTIAIDDAVQHYKQLKDPKYRSLLHKLYGKTLYKLGFIRKLNALFDKVFGR